MAANSSSITFGLATSPLLAFVAGSDAERAKAFYGEALGLPLRSDDPFALIFNANGTTLRVQKTQAVSPPPYTVLGWQVDDIAAMVRQLVGRGVHFERFPGMPQDDLGIWTTPDGARIAWFKDPEGHILSLGQPA